MNKIKAIFNLTMAQSLFIIHWHSASSLLWLTNQFKSMSTSQNKKLEIAFQSTERQYI